MDIIKSIEHEQLKSKVPDIKVGDTIRVHQRIKEGNRERIQVFEGIVIKKQNGGLNETFTVRRVAYGVGVEKTFLLHSPLVEKVELVRVGKVRRAKLYYLRDRIGKEEMPVQETASEVEETTETTVEVTEQAQEVVTETATDTAPVEEKAEAKEVEKVEEKTETAEAVAEVPADEKKAEEEGK